MRSEHNKLVPVLFVLALIAFIGADYVYFHLLPLLQLDKNPSDVDKSDQQKGTVRSILWGFATGMLLLCYWLAVVTEPGFVPDEAMWRYAPGNQYVEKLGSIMQEKKRNNELRHCKWCGKYKPDRTHHCRVYGTCILKMDHHCPWIFNTVGFKNHKYFFLILFYSVLDLWLIVVTFWESLMWTMEEDTPFGVMFLVMFGETLAAFIGAVVTVFFGFHCWLILKNMTTIEFCEKSSGKNEYSSIYSGSVYHNIC